MRALGWLGWVRALGGVTLGWVRGTGMAGRGEGHWEGMRGEGHWEG